MTATRVPDYPTEGVMEIKCFCAVISADYAEDEIVFIRLDSRNENSLKGHDPKKRNLCYESVMKRSDSLHVLNQTGGMAQHHHGPKMTRKRICKLLKSLANPLF